MPHQHPTASVITAALIAALIAGCTTIKDPDQQPQPTSTTTAARVTTAADSGDPAPERGGTIPTQAQAAQTRLAPDAGSISPRAALARYARLYVNWNAAGVLARQQQLASISLGQARAQALQAAADIKGDPLLSRSHVANSGQIIAIAPGQGTATGEWVIVTREHTTGQGSYSGLPPTIHVTYAQLTHTPKGWLIDRWAPQT
jgi:hypothetical protein